MTVAEEAHDEWDYRVVENSFGQEFDTSIPCQLRFTDETEQDTDAFHTALERIGYEPTERDPDKRRGGSTGPYYDGELVSTETYTRLKVLVFRGNVVRIYPYDNTVPTVETLAKILGAIEEGFNAELEHDPIQ